MLNPAQLADVEDRWRPLDGQDAVTVKTWLDDAWNTLTIESPGIEDRIENDVVPEPVVVAVLAEAVIRKAKNADGKRQQSITIDDATRSWTLNDFAASGELKFTDSELLRLSGKPGKTRVKAFSVMPS